MRSGEITKRSFMVGQDEACLDIIGKRSQDEIRIWNGVDRFGEWMHRQKPWWWDEDQDVMGRFGEWMLRQRAWGGGGRIRGNRSETSPLDSWIIYRITAPSSCTLSNVMRIHVLKSPLSDNQGVKVIDFDAIEFWVENLTL